MSSFLRLALIVSTPPVAGDFQRAFSLARAARARNIDVGLFFMHEAVTGLPTRRSALSALADDGCELIACASSAEQFAISSEDLPLILGSQDDHAALVQRADRVVAFT